jgi:hypothetical protein
MKNLLSENMLRFGTKNLSESAKKKLVFESIMQTIKEHGLTNAIRKQLTEATVKVDSPSNGYIDVTVPTDSKTLGTASKIIGTLLAAFGGGGTDDAKAGKAIYSINTPELYYAVLYKVQTSPVLKTTYGKNFKLVGEFLSEDMTFAAGTSTGGMRTTQSPGAVIQQLTGAQAQYKDYERHLRQFNLSEYIKQESSN